MRQNEIKNRSIPPLVSSSREMKWKKEALLTKVRKSRKSIWKFV